MLNRIHPEIQFKPEREFGRYDGRLMFYDYIGCTETHDKKTRLRFLWNNRKLIEFSIQSLCRDIKLPKPACVSQGNIKENSNGQAFQEKNGVYTE